MIIGLIGFILLISCLTTGLLIAIKQYTIITRYLFVITLITGFIMTRYDPSFTIFIDTIIKIAIAGGIWI
jgi:hypothetical protein